MVTRHSHNYPLAFADNDFEHIANQKACWLNAVTDSSEIIGLQLPKPMKSKMPKSTQSPAGAGTRVLILGGTGFLGSVLSQLLITQGFQVAILSRRSNSKLCGSKPTAFLTSDSDWIKSCLSFRPEVVINLLASWRGSSEAEIESSNKSVPLSFAREYFAHSTGTWVQVNSYFNYFYDEFGIDKDQYSRARRELSEMLKSYAIRSRVNCIEIRLPHLIGVGQHSSQLIPAAIRTMKSEGGELSVASGNAVVPLLDVSDGARQIFAILKQRTKIIAFDLVASRPSTQLKVVEILNLVRSLTVSKSQVIYGAHLDRPNEFYKKIHFSGKHLSSIDSMSLREIEFSLNHMLEKFGE